MHPLLYHYYYIAILLPYCPPRSLPCNLTSDTPPPSRPRGRDILPSPPSSLTFQGSYIPLSSLISLSFQGRDIPPSSLSLQGRDIPLSSLSSLNFHSRGRPQLPSSSLTFQGRDIPLTLPPATFQEGVLTTDVFRSLPQWHTLMCASVKDV